MERLGVGLRIIGGKRDESGMVIDQEAQMGRQCFASDRKSWTGREVHHPQVIDVRSFEGFGGTGFQATGAQAFAVHTLAAQATVDYADGGQGAQALLPM